MKSKQLTPTTKFNQMIEAFECDFELAKEDKHTLEELQNKIRAEDKKLLDDIDLLLELSFLLRYGKACICLIEDAE